MLFIIVLLEKEYTTMADYENNAYFWLKVDTLFLSSTLTISRHKGETHPNFKNSYTVLADKYIKETYDGAVVPLF